MALYGPGLVHIPFFAVVSAALSHWFWKRFLTMGSLLEEEDDFAEFFAEVFAGVFGLIFFPTATLFLLNTTGFFFGEGFLCINDLFNTAVFLVRTGAFGVVSDFVTFLI